MHLVKKATKEQKLVLHIVQSEIRMIIYMRE